MTLFLIFHWELDPELNTKLQTGASGSLHTTWFQKNQQAANWEMATLSPSVPTHLCLMSWASIPWGMKWPVVPVGRIKAIVQAPRAGPWELKEGAAWSGASIVTQRDLWQPSLVMICTQWPITLTYSHKAVDQLWAVIRAQPGPESSWLFSFFCEDHCQPSLAFYFMITCPCSVGSVVW